MMTTYLYTVSEFQFYALPHGNGFYAVRDGARPGLPNGGPRYHCIEDDEVEHLDYAVGEFVRCEGLSDADLMDEAGGEYRVGVEGPARRELARRDRRAAA